MEQYKTKWEGGDQWKKDRAMLTSIEAGDKYKLYVKEPHWFPIEILKLKMSNVSSCLESHFSQT